MFITKTVHLTLRAALLAVLITACEKKASLSATSGNSTNEHTSATGPAVLQQPTAAAQHTEPPEPPAQIVPQETARVATTAIHGTIPAAVPDSAGLSNAITKITAWIDTWFVNTQINSCTDCTNLINVLLTDEHMRTAVHDALAADGSPYHAAAAMLTWIATSNETVRAQQLDTMRRTATAQTWPFYMYAMCTTPTNVALMYLMPPDELLTRVFKPETLWDAALVGLGIFYRDCAGEGALISYWDELKARRPALAGAAVVHQIAAAQRMNAPDQVIAILRQGLDDVRKQQWTIDRAMWTLNAISHPDVLIISNALLAPKN